ncbi:hypothetical protein PoB_001946600 [Plakobranchus ocellatus]|uniref:DUF19 domain-containing protein n=1 Tax=Plakobranchus ocellatus TaxID=259542 RepID=A0AAV3Z0V9_9GAST|nr:hypothetical protein PoB_001946600 [Plakobranchus ocellatus]
MVTFAVRNSLLLRIYRDPALNPLPALWPEVKGDCSELLACENTITESSFFAEDTGVVGYMNEAEAMDVICTELSNLTSCISNKLGTCDDATVKNEVKAAKDIIEYMCSPEGKQVVISLASSPCADNPLLEIQMEIMMQGCLETFQFDLQMEAMNAAFSGRDFEMSDACPFIDQLETCLIQGSTQMCGAQMGTFMAKIWDIATRDQFSEFGCSHSVIHSRRYVKRALPMLSKRLATISKLKLRK